MRRMVLAMVLIALAVAARARVLEGVVVCEGCPRAPIHVIAYPAVDRYNWPWWEVYGFLRGFHSLTELDAMRPTPLAVTTLGGPGAFRMTLPDVPAYLFARLDVERSGPAVG